MAAFTEDEQWESDLDWYAIDRDERIGQFLTAGHRLLPPSFGSNKEMTEQLSDYFESLPFDKTSFIICPNFKKNDLMHKDTKILTVTGLLIDIDENMSNKLIDDWIARSDELSHFGMRMASRGLYSYDSNTMAHKNFRPYYRFAIPKKELRLNDLPQAIKAILENLRMPEISFAEASLIPVEITDRL